MKAVGMFFIVFGHVVGAPFNQFTQPIYPKQLGVAFFVFITGWSLANENRPRLRVVFNRIFPVYLFGVGCALVVSLLFFFIKNDTNPSNYLPFFLGINVLFNNFPANPTTWYIGTYLHLLLFWYFFLHGGTIRTRHLLLACTGEIIIRAIFMALGKGFIAYMLLPNWLTIFLLGFFLSKKQDETDKSKLPVLAIIWVGLFVFWAWAGNTIGFDTSFPFRNFAGGAQNLAVFRSTLVSLLYIAHTLIFFAIARRLPHLAAVSFFSRNTLIIFIAHMPVINQCSPFIYSLFDSVFVKKLILILILYIGLALFSELLHKMINVKKLREKIWQAGSLKVKAGR